MTKAIILSMALSAILMSLIASSAAKAYKTEEISTKEIAVVSTCAQQIWPSFTQDCLLTIQGQKSNRKFRIVF